MTTIQIPKTGTAQDRRINEKYGIHRIAGWELAALIYARCEPGQRKSRQLDIQSAKLAGSMSSGRVSFAELSRVTGRSEVNIRHHWNNWQHAIDQGWALPAVAGETVTLPEQDYPPTGQSHGLNDKLKADAPPEEKVAAIQEILRRDPEVERRLDNQFVQKVASSLPLRSRVAAAVAEHHVSPEPEPKPISGLPGTGLGATLLREIERIHTKYTHYLIILHGMEDRDRARSMVLEDLDRLEEVRTKITEIEEDLRRSVQMDTDSVLSRLSEKG